MAARTKLSQRVLPAYSRAEETMNMTTHIAGGALGIAAVLLCLLRSIARGGAADIAGAAIYGAAMVLLYTVSSVYHGLSPCMAKKVMQVIDHCAIYFLICGTYTPILLSSFTPVYPAIGWGLLGLQWALAILAATFTAIDLKKYRVLSMVCYLCMGWSILVFLPQTLAVVGSAGFELLLAGGIAYSLGAVLYGIGSKVPWMHSVFHIFVVLGSALQFLAIYLYVLP